MPSAVHKAKPRSSRLSSPPAQTGPQNTSAGSAGWREPALRNNKATFEDHGGMPYGVLEDMQPLGQRPSAKVRARVKAEPLRKSLGKSLGATGDLAGARDVTPSQATRRSNSFVPEDTVTMSEPVSQHTPGEEDEGSAASKSTRQRRHRPSSVASEAVQAPAPFVQENDATENKSATSQSPARKSRTSELSSDDLDDINLDEIMEIALKRARELDYNDFGDALNQMYIESRENERYAHLIRDVLLQTASVDEKDEFERAIKRAKRTLKRQRRRQTGTSTVKEALKTPHTHGISASPQIEAERPELVPLPSVEVNSETTRLRASTRRRTALASSGANHEESPHVNGSSARPRRRTGMRKSSHSQSPAPGAMVTDIAHGVRADATQAISELPTAVSHRLLGVTIGEVTDDSSLRLGIDADSVMPDWPEADVAVNGSEAAQSASARGESLIPQSGQTGPKRSPTDAGFTETGRDAIEYVKRRKLRETLYQDLDPTKRYTQSEERATLDSARSLRKREAIDYRSPQPITATSMPASTPINPRTRRGRDLTDSPLSDMSSTPPAENVEDGLRTGRTLKRAKTKTSPEKRPALNAAEEKGARRASPDEGEESDNNDYCNACGGHGTLLCCDGCDRSFHFYCVDPPLKEDSSALDEPFFCYNCIAKRNPPARQPRGLFALLLQNLDKRNPSIFALPAKIRNYYGNVHTGKDGRFEDPANIKTRTRAGYDEPLDLLKQKDSKGNSILCYHCGRSAAGKREIITCDICGNNWHLDCTDPPLANPPFRDQLNRKSRDWMCPLHIEHDLAAIDPMRLARKRRIHIRRPKNARVMDTQLRRGHVNNGIIEIMEDDSDETESEFGEDETASGTVSRVPAKGVKLDFIDKVHRVRAVEYEMANSLSMAQHPCVEHSAARSRYENRGIAERKTILGLVQLASNTLDLALSKDKIINLIDTLVVEAPDAVVNGVAEAERKAASAYNALPNGTDFTQDLARQQSELESLLELVKRRLASIGGFASTATV